MWRASWHLCLTDDRYWYVRQVPGTAAPGNHTWCNIIEHIFLDSVCLTSNYYLVVFSDGKPPPRYTLDSVHCPLLDLSPDMISWSCPMAFEAEVCMYVLHMWMWFPQSTFRATSVRADSSSTILRSRERKALWSQTYGCHPRRPIPFDRKVQSTLKQQNGCKCFAMCSF